MGVLFAKPLTKDDLDKALAPIKEDVGKIKEALLVPDGNVFAAKATVAIGETGHGAILKVSGDQDRFFLLSSTHVLIDQTSETTVNIQYNHNGKKNLEVERGALYLKEEYILSGTNDCGLLELRNFIPEDFEEAGWNVGDPTVGKSIVGHGRVFLRGTVTSMSEGSHFTVFAHTVPGSSGTPLFDNTKKLVGVVHGSSKHRGRQSARGVDNATVAYGHPVQLNDLKRIDANDDTLQLLRWAEDVPLEVLDQLSLMTLEAYVSSHETDGMKDLVARLGIQVDVNLTLALVMDNLKREVDKTALDADFLFGSLRLMIRNQS